MAPDSNQLKYECLSPHNLAGVHFISSDKVRGAHWKQQQQRKTKKKTCDLDLDRCAARLKIFVVGTLLWMGVLGTVTCM